MPLTRRRLLQGSGLLAFATALRAAPDRPQLAAALQAAAWIHRARIETKHGVTWPASPGDLTFDPESPDHQTLYSHGPGVVLFLLELHRATGDRAFLDEAQRGADHLVALFPAFEQAGYSGLYSGMAGTAYVLELVHRVSRQRRYHDAAVRLFDALHRKAQIDSGRAVWNEYNDIISGTAGTGLALLWWAHATKDARALLLAQQAGRDLIARAEATDGDGLKWRSAVTMEKLYPNFSHGTAGVGYFLTRLYAATREREFLAAALGGARHLLAIADTHDESCKVYHHTEQDGSPSDLYYWSWCHGPVGSWRLFHQLGVSTRAQEWRPWVRRCARAVLSSGIPQQRLPGFWNNVSLCCGNAGIAQGFLDLYRAYGTAEYLRFSGQVAAEMVQQGTTDEQGLRWTQAEHRVQPENLMAQTGLMQGAAGMGTVLLHLDGQQRRRTPLAVLPDSPFTA